MTPISGRYGIAVLLLVLLAWIPVTFLAGPGRDRDDCLRPDRFWDLARVPGTLEVHQRVDRLSETRIQWSEGSAVPMLTRGARFAYRVVRTFDPYYMLGRPTAVLPRGFAEDWDRMEVLETAQGELPVRLLFKGHGSHVELIAYAFFYEGKPVRSPFISLLRSALSSFLGGRHPLTVVMVQGRAPSSEQGLIADEALDWIEGVRGHYAAACNP